MDNLEHEAQDSPEMDTEILDILDKIQKIRLVVETCRDDKSLQRFVHTIPTRIYNDAMEIIKSKRLTWTKDWLSEISYLEESPPLGRNKEDNVVYLAIRKILLEQYLFDLSIPNEKDFWQKLGMVIQKDKLPLLLKDNGFILYTLPKTNKRIITEDPRIRAERILYLNKMIYHERCNRHIFSLEERIVSFQYPELDSRTFRGDCLHCMILYDNFGKIHDSLIIFQLRVDAKIAHKIVVNFINRNRHLLLLPEQCVLRISDMEHHNPTWPDVPTIFSSRKQMTDWLEHYSIEYTPNSHRAELYRLVKASKHHTRNRFEMEYVFSSIDNDIEVVRVPNHLRNLNPFDYLWNIVGEKVKNLMKSTSSGPKSFIMDRSLLIQQIKKLVETYGEVLKEKITVIEQKERQTLKEDLQMEEVLDKLAVFLNSEHGAKYRKRIVKNSDMKQLEAPSKNVATSFDEKEVLFFNWD